MMEVDDEAKESDVNTTKATPSVTVVAPTIVVPAVSTQQRVSICFGSCIVLDSNQFTSLFCGAT